VLVEERRQRVLDLISQRGFVSLADLAQSIQMSESTLRRDLDHWHEKGVVRRTHGGAMFVGDGNGLPALEDRATRQLEEKRAIARAAVERIRDGDAILLDGGTTTLEIARLLVGRSLQVVTNSLPIAGIFASSRETDLIVLGGYVYPKTGVALGPLTMKVLPDVHVNQVYLSCSGITARGLFNSNSLLVETQREMMRCGDEVVLAVDHSKIGRPALAFLCEMNEIDTLIVDAGITAGQRELVAASDTRLIVAGETGEFGS
jgi:DeoR family transcriptional regulator, fructose operon transcriptional repressor